jgi:hypothetical protein
MTRLVKLPDTWNPGELGPAMLRLTEKQRKYVLAMAAAPFDTPPSWARAAGYSDHKGRARVAAFYLVRDAKVQEAVLEIGKALLGTTGPVIAASVLLRIAKDPEHPKQLRAALEIADRVGMHPIQEVHVHRTDETIEAKIERIKVIAAMLGIPVADLLGRNVTGATNGDGKLIEHTAPERSEAGQTPKGNAG